MQTAPSPSSKSLTGCQLILPTFPTNSNTVCYSTILPFVPTMPRGFASYYNKYHPYTTLRNICTFTCPPYTSSVYRC